MKYQKRNFRLLIPFTELILLGAFIAPYYSCIFLTPVTLLLSAITILRLIKEKRMMHSMCCCYSI